MHTKYLVTAVACLSVLASGCATHEHKLSSSSANNIVVGKVIHGNPSLADQLIVETSGKRFEGELAIKKHLNWESVRKAYGSDSTHWQKIRSGQDKDHHTSVGTADIKSPDGEVMQCKLIWARSDRPEGECVDKTGKSLELRFE